MGTAMRETDTTRKHTASTLQRTLSALALALLAFGGILLPASARALAAGGKTSYFHHARPGYLGVDLEDLTPQQRATFHLQDKQGVAIAAVDHDAPAGHAGLHVQDVVLQINGRPVRNAAQARSILARTTVGQSVALMVLHNGQTSQKTVQLADRREVEKQAWSQRYSVPDPAKNATTTAPQIQAPPAQQTTPPPPQGILGQASSEFSKTFGPNGLLMSLVPGASSIYTGLDVVALGPQLAQYFGIHDGTGLIVKSVDRNSPGERAGAHAGDIVLKVNDVPMTSRSKWMHVLREDRNSLLLLQVLRDHHPMTLTMSIHATH